MSTIHLVSASVDYPSRRIYWARIPDILRNTNVFTDNASFSDVACGFQHSHRGGLGFANEDVGSQHDKRNAFSRLLSVVVCFLKAFAKLLNRVGRMNFVGSTAWF